MRNPSRQRKWGSLQPHGRQCWGKCSSACDPPCHVYAAPSIKAPPFSIPHFVSSFTTPHSPPPRLPHTEPTTLLPGHAPPLRLEEGNGRSASGHGKPPWPVTETGLWNKIRFLEALLSVTLFIFYLSPSLVKLQQKIIFENFKRNVEVFGPLDLKNSTISWGLFLDFNYQWNSSTSHFIFFSLKKITPQIFLPRINYY